MWTPPGSNLKKLSMMKVKEELNTPPSCIEEQPSTSFKNGVPGGGLLSLPKRQKSHGGREKNGHSNVSKPFNTSPPVFSMEALNDVLGGFLSDGEQTQFEFGLENFEQKLCLDDLSTLEQNAENVAAALFNATKKSATSTNQSTTSTSQQQETSFAGLLSSSNSKNITLPSTSTSLPQMEHPLLEALYSPNSPLTSPIYPVVIDPTNERNGESDSNKNGSHCPSSDSDFDVDGESSSSEDSSDTDFYVDDSDSDYKGGRYKRHGMGRGMRGRRGGMGGSMGRKLPYYHQKKANKPKDVGGALPGTGGTEKPSTSRQINAHQLEAIAASMGSSPVTVNWLVQNYETSEGNSLPRALMYGHYLRHCAELRLDPVNAASFGKLIRSVFVGLTTRRLGTRGNSKYHYCGIRIKDTSTLLLEDPDLSKKTRTNGKRSKKTQILAMQGVGICGLGGNKGLTLELDSRGKIEYKSVKKYLGSRGPTFPNIEINESAIPVGFCYQNILDFTVLYKHYCWEIMETMELFKLQRLENVWKRFWQNGVCEFNKVLPGISKDRLMALTSSPEVQYAMQHWDAFTFDRVLSILLPTVIAQVPFQLLEEYHKFSLKLRSWLLAALESYNPDFIQLKMQLLASFIDELKSWISLNMSAQAARDSMQSPNSIAQLLSDLNRINFRSVLMDVKEYVNVDEMDINVHESLKRILSGPDSIEPWSVWLVGLVEQRLGMSTKVKEASDGASTFNAVVKECQDLSLRWLKYMSQLKLELLLRSSGSLSTFLSLELLFSNFLLHLIKVYKSRALEVPLTLYSIVRKSQGVGRQQYPSINIPAPVTNPNTGIAENLDETKPFIDHQATTDDDGSDTTDENIVENPVRPETGGLAIKVEVTDQEPAGTTNSEIKKKENHTVVKLSIPALTVVKQEVLDD